MVVLPRPRILLAIVATITLLGGVGGLIAISWLDRDATLADARDSLRMTSRLVESHVRALHLSGQEILARIGDHMIAHPDPTAVRGWIVRLIDANPYIFAVHVLDAQGEPLVSSEDPSPPLGEADRVDIRVALAQPGRTVFGVLRRQVDGEDMSFVLSRAYADERGRVVGVARILVSNGYFTTLCRELNPPPGAVFSVLRRDGLVLARFPILDAPRWINPNAHPFTTIYAKAPQGVYRAKSVLDGYERLVSFRTLADLDILVLAGVTVDTLFQGWQVRTQHATALVAMALLLLLGLTAVADESLRHEARLMGSIKQKAEELAAALADKDVLFQEVHHRVKNNLQVISSLLTMQLLNVKDEVARASLQDALDRIHSMGMVHQTLYEHNLAASVDLGAYFGKLAEALASSYGSGRGGVTVEVDVTGALELERAVPLGLLANEALSNALKHAFVDARTGTVVMSLACEGQSWRLIVRDDGIGIPDKPGPGIGISLIRALSRQLNGSVVISARPEGGTEVRLDFPA